ncbi:peptidoglycan-binding protein [Aestuariivirga sp.]|uniref:peptidoglycan-binding protein n=1 Tax=Aestuariivirga sp. TaxID=2650926 RepID=UPI0039E5AFA5
MREEYDDEPRRWKLATVFAWAAIGVISTGVLYNTLWLQGGKSGITDVAQGNNPQNVAAASGTTIQLKYDPVVEEVQRQLLASGYYKGDIDGVTGKRTKQAIQAYQQANGLTVTGEPTPDLADHIRYTREVAEASIFTGSVEPDPDAEARAQIRRVQTGLAELAYSPGVIDGKMNDQTKGAITKFQHDRGLAETGKITPDLLAELSKLSGQSDISSN